MYDQFKYEEEKRKATHKAKKYLKDKGYKNAMVHCTRGTFHLTNGGQYFLTAANVLKEATGLIFNELNSYMARLDKNQFQ